eukprot:CAMPEP_0113933808 /NCGR_PEP_ID=MMETSP1339-20121228/1115_1 /TAXON_ID=94617 /ORGANISM="Fibrocapsa japonica" /LENGTH=443 /DNA_ID=CAMNT_0000935285 /DNA_START=127 /DNA_END=1458 /DNA_ORIENTATION=- /assembly_acc=CAM_ASM_000762
MALKTVCLVCVIAVAAGFQSSLFTQHASTITRLNALPFGIDVPAIKSEVPMMQPQSQPAVVQYTDNTQRDQEVQKFIAAIPDKLDPSDTILNLSCNEQCALVQDPSKVTSSPGMKRTLRFYDLKTGEVSMTKTSTSVMVECTESCSLAKGPSAASSSTEAKQPTIVAAAKAPFKKSDTNTPKDWSYRPNGFIADENNPCGAGTGVPCGPENWGFLYKGGLGVEQSPINIAQARVDKKLTPIDFKVESPVPEVYLKASQHNWQATIPPEHVGKLAVQHDGETYELLQFHFHSPSEHAFGGGLYDAEVHLVHKGKTNGKLMVLGVMLEAQKGFPNQVLDPLWKEGFQEGKGKFVDLRKVGGLNPYMSMLPPDPSYFNYAGSLTTPGLSEGVNWIVFKEPVRMSEAQLTKFRNGVAALDESQAAEGNTNRPLQPLNARNVKMFAGL